jgi:hypothetical protein
LDIVDALVRHDVSLQSTSETHMDEADLTAQRMEHETAALIAAARAQAVVGTAISFSMCRQCEEILPKERGACGFCSPECRDDFQKVAAANQRAGRTNRA